MRNEPDRCLFLVCEFSEKILIYIPEEKSEKIPIDYLKIEQRVQKFLKQKEEEKDQVLHNKWLHKMLFMMD